MGIPLADNGHFVSDRIQRLKDARSEATKEIEELKAQKNQEYQNFVAQVTNDMIVVYAWIYASNISCTHSIRVRRMPALVPWIKRLKSRLVKSKTPSLQTRKRLLKRCWMLSSTFKLNPISMLAFKETEWERKKRTPHSA